MNLRVPRLRPGAIDFIALIPARLASTRLPGKPLADIGGMPMVVRVAERARASGAARVIVACDDETIAAAVRAYGHEVVVTRADHRSGTDRIAEVVADLLRDHAIVEQTIVVNVQGDEPLIDPALIEATARALAEAPDCSIATACHPIASREDLVNPNIVKVVVDARGHAMYFSRAPIPFDRDGDSSKPIDAYRHIGLYAYRAGFLPIFSSMRIAPLEEREALEQLRALWHGHSIVVFTTDSAPASGVDTPEDLARVRGLIGVATGASHD